MIRFADPLWLLGLSLLVPLFLWDRHCRKRGHRYLFYSSRRLLPAPARGWRPLLVRHLFSAQLAALALLIIALAGPQRIETFRTTEVHGCDILLTLDISGSMASVDFKPQNRLEVAKEVIARFIERRSTDRLGLVTFAATAYTRCPLTIDDELLRQSLAETQLGDIEDGTAIGMGLATAVNRLKNSTAKTRILILLTDGINNRGEIDPRDAATMARDFGVRIYTIGVGTRGQAPYPVTDPFGNRQFVMVDVEIDEQLLKEIAARTGGLYFRATDRESLAGVFTEIDRWEKTDIKVRETHEKYELFPYFLGLGLLLGVLVEVARRTAARVLP